MLKIEELSFGYGKKDVLRGVNLELNAGEIGILLGKNGAGKTTLFRSIIGVNCPKKGKILFDGKELSKMSGRARAKKIAYVPQDIRFGELSVFDSVLMGRVSRFGFSAKKSDYEKTSELLREMGLSEYSEQSAETLSGGERQKVAIARALNQEPRLLVLDEPTGNLDISNELLLVSEAKKLARKRNIGILSSLHDLSRALSFGDRFFLMKDGKIKYSCDKNSVDEKMLVEIFDVDIKIVDIEGQRIVLGGNL